MSDLHPRHASRVPLAVRVAVPLGVLFTAVASLAALGGVPAAPTDLELPVPAAAMTLPDVEILGERAANPCIDPDVRAALVAGDDPATVRAFGGGESFRAAVVAGNAPCVSLSDPAREWVVVNKLRPLQPQRFVPAALAGADLTSVTSSNELRPDATSALEAMAEAARAAGAGMLGLNNGYRSYGMQEATYGTHVRTKGTAGADAVSARPGFSEHQSGLAFDLVACAPSCGDLDAFGSTEQGRWVAANAWRHGFIVRYEAGRTAVTGYSPEPWHIRYIGHELAETYHRGGFHSLEEFFGLPPAPDYAH